MRILADSNITDATITGTNVLSFAPEEKLQIFQLSDKFKTTSGTTQIILDYGSSEACFSSVALCGTNISENASITLSYSDSSPTTPELSIPLPEFSNFNQIWFLDEAICRRYWVIDIVDPEPQDSTGLEIGYIYIGEYTQLGSVSFPHSPALNLSSQPSLSATGQGYGSKGYNTKSLECTVYADKDGLEDIFSIIKTKQNIDPVVLVPFEDSLDNTLYPPMYCALTADSYAYPMDGDSGIYALAITAAERF